MQLQGSLLSTHRDALHDELEGRNEDLARIARFASAGPPQTLGMLFWGNRPSASFCRIKRRMVLESKGESMGAFSGSDGEHDAGRAVRLIVQHATG